MCQQFHWQFLQRSPVVQHWIWALVNVHWRPFSGVQRCALNIGANQRRRLCLHPSSKTRIGSEAHPFVVTGEGDDLLYALFQLFE